MNTPDQPLSPELLDELLSADLDGEFDRAAGDLGYTAAEAHAAIGATPGAEARRDALVRARDRLAVRPPLTGDDEQRIVALALMRADEVRHARDRRAERRKFERSWRVLVAVGSAAALVAVIVGLGTRNPAGDAKSSGAAIAPERAASAATPTTRIAGKARSKSVAFGVVAGADALRRQVHAVVNAPVKKPAPSADSAVTTTWDATQSPSVPGVQGATGAVGVTGPTGAEVGKSAGGEQGLAVVEGLLALAAPRGLVGHDGVVVDTPTAAAYVQFSARTAPVLAPATSTRCLAVGAGAAGLPRTLVVTGTATYEQRPAAVVVFRQGQSYVAYVLSVPGCSVVARVAVP